MLGSTLPVCWGGDIHRGAPVALYEEHFLSLFGMTGWFASSLSASEVTETSHTASETDELLVLSCCCGILPGIKEKMMNTCTAQQ